MLTRPIASDILHRISVMFPPTTSTAKPSAPADQTSARHLAKYVFPRQFGLHNAFTSPKARGSFEVLPDYDNRELEIKVSKAVSDVDPSSFSASTIARRKSGRSRRPVVSSQPSICCRR